MFSDIPHFACPALTRTPGTAAGRRPGHVAVRMRLPHCTPTPCPAHAFAPYRQPPGLKQQIISFLEDGSILASWWVEGGRSGMQPGQGSHCMSSPPGRRQRTLHCRAGVADKRTCETPAPTTAPPLLPARALRASCHCPAIQWHGAPPRLTAHLRCARPRLLLFGSLAAREPVGIDLGACHARRCWATGLATLAGHYEHLRAPGGKTRHWALAREAGRADANMVPVAGTKTRQNSVA